MQFSSKTINSGNNAKTIKGDGAEYVTAIMYLAPYNMSGFNVCAMAETAGCIEACLNTAGRGAFTNVQNARIAKTKRFMTDRAAFMLQLEKDIECFARRVINKGAQPCIRLNGTSDIRFESIAFIGADGERYANIMARFPDLTFYDYTKLPNRKNVPDNYKLTYSYSAVSETAEMAAWGAKKAGFNIAVVFSGAIPAEFMGMRTIDGDKDDLRFLDPRGVVVALKAKGKAKKDESGFVVHWERDQRAAVATLKSRFEAARRAAWSTGLKSDYAHTSELGQLYNAATVELHNAIVAR